ncbi:MAG: hypothetical protein BWY19_00438 [bacterium ADurb.Bin212]|nr:MAG: hypothetical protein BWY19_00438 [bacterium ADurb.Bin212]
MKIKNIRISIFLIVALAVTALLLSLNFIGADEISTSVVIKGKVFESLDNTSFGKAAAGVNVMLVDAKGDSSSSTTDANGNYSVTVNNPLPCGYTVFLSGEKYNAKKISGFIVKAAAGSSLMSKMLSPASSTNFFIDRETDLMHSIYNGSKYQSGYNGFYHLSKWDVHYLRNNISINQLKNRQAPSSATFSIPVSRVSNISIGMNSTAVPKATVKFEVFAVTSNWSASNSISTSGKSLQTINMPLDSLLKTTEIKFDFSLSGLTDEQKYQSWINGFSIKTYVVPDPLVKQDINPDILIPTSESRDFKIVAPITYSGLTALKDPFVCNCKEILHTSVRTTTFAGCGSNGKCADSGDNCIGSSGISTGCNAPTQYFASLPYSQIASQCKGDIKNCMKIKVTNPNNGKSVILAVVDSGPCNIKDADYVCGPNRPSVESGVNLGGCEDQGSNAAGLDISPTAMKFLGANSSERYNWQFVGGGNLGPAY